MKSLYALLLCLTLTSCAGMFTPGPVDPTTGVPGPSPWQAGLDAAAQNYDDAPWKEFGPYGALIALAIAGFYGVRKGYSIRVQRRSGSTSASTSTRESSSDS